MQATTITLEREGPVAILVLDRPDKANAMEEAMWHELREAMRHADETPEIRVVVLKGAGRHFTAGIDLAMLEGLAARLRDEDGARSREKLRRLILDLQDTLTAFERCRKPVIAAVHGACYGGGMDLVTACDIRHCSADARFSVKEIDVGMTADVGTLQRLPRVIGDGPARELIYTGRDIDAARALAIGLVNEVLPDADAVQARAHDVAREIAANSPLAVQGSKQVLSQAVRRDVQAGLDYVALWNAAFLHSEDLGEAIAAFAQKRPPVYKGR